MLKKIFFVCLFLFLTNCAQVSSLLPNDVFRTAMTQTGEYIMKKKTGKTTTEHALSAATKKDCAIDVSTLAIENPCKEKAID